MSTNLAVIDRGAMSKVQARMQTILDVMANVLEEGKDYGRIPGTDKPSLYKPGAEKLMLTFQLAAARPTIDDLSTDDDAVRYRVTVPIEGPDGRALAVGIGEASSNEEKYRWRKPVVDEEFFDTPEAMRREKWFRGKDGKPNWKGKQVRTSPADVANTILKMAHKRGFIHGTLLATGASSVFNQDLEDFAQELRESVIDDDDTPAARAPKKTVQRASETGRRAAAATADAVDPALLVTEPRRVKSIRVFGKTNSNYAVKLEGDPIEYTTRNGTLAQEIEKFVNTTHLVRLSYRVNESQGTTYYNIENCVVADPPTVAAAKPTAPAPATEPPPSAQDIPFGTR